MAAIAVDTHVVVRLLVADDEPQAARARRLFEAGEVWIGVTVLLEAAWVLTSVYELTTAEAASALRRLLGLPNVGVENAGLVSAALDASQHGLDFADALHLLRAPDGAEFATFDRILAKGGRKLRPVRLL
jgi:predicted nucleic acid-binding protein